MISRLGLPVAELYIQVCELNRNMVQLNFHCIYSLHRHYGQLPPQGYSHSQVPAATPQIPNDFASGSASGGAQNPSHLFRPNINALPYSSL